MKKILTHLTGIVFVLSILIAGGCGPADDTEEPAKVKADVKITLKAIEKNGKKHLSMFDSNNPNNVVEDTLETLVKPGDIVVWKLKFRSGIKNIDQIKPNTPGTIIVQDAEPIPGTKKFKLKIPDGAPVGSEREKYDIKFVDKEGKTWEIDPYLKIR